MSGVFAGYTQPLEQSYDYFNGMFENILTQSNLQIQIHQQTADQR